MLRPSVLAALALSPWLAAQDTPFGEILPGHECRHVFEAARDGLQGVAVPIATFARTNSCTLIAELFAGDTPLAHGEWRAARLRDNAEVELPCPPQPTSRGTKYTLVLRSPDAKPGDAVTTWITPGGGPRLRTSFAGDTLMLGEITADVRVVQTFVAAADGLCGVQVLLTDFGRRNRGSLRLSLRDPIAGSELAAATIDAATVGNEDWRALEFAPIPDSGGRSLALTLESADSQPGSAATAYLERGATYRGELSVADVPRLGRLMLTTAYAATGSSLANWLGAASLAASALCAFAAVRARRRRRRSRTWIAAAIAAMAVPLLGYAYAGDRRLLFWIAAFVGGLALPVVAAAARRWRVVAVQLAIVPLLSFVLLLIAEPFGAARTAKADGGRSAADVDLHDAPWSYERSQGDPDAFRRWWQRLTGEWNSPDRGCALVQRPDPLGELPFVLQPNSTTRFFESTIRVDNLGFRGPDIDRDKHGAFRIVCLGESTTMGQTLFATDRPWPEALQERLADPKKRRVEVINAGWASYDVRHSAIRLRRFVLDLEPDLVVVYHGYNGFWMLLPDVAPALVAGARLPRHTERPSWLLADAEYAIALSAFRRTMATPPSGAAVDVAASQCARAYRELIDTCTARGIAVALCSFNMAVDAQSPPEVVAFYRAGFPQVERQIAANALQTELLRRLAAPERRVVFVDTGAGLTGAYGDAFVDLVHFTQTGRERMAANVATGIRTLLPD